MDKSKEDGSMEIEERIIDIIVEQLDVPREKCIPSADFRADFKTDSLELVELVMTMENALGVVVPDSELAKIRTVGDVITYVQSKLSKTAEQAG